jgi:ankyrin repeat protein
MHVTASKSLGMSERTLKIRSNTVDEIVGAVYREDLSKLEAILASGVPIDAPDSDGRTPLMHAVLASPVSERVVAWLLSKGADANAHDNGQCWTALHFAARDGNPEIVHLLIQSGAKVDALDAFGNTPMWRATIAAPRNPGCVECIGLLLEAGADPDMANSSGVSPRVLAQDPGQEAALRLIQGSWRS